MKLKYFQKSIQNRLTNKYYPNIIKLIVISLISRLYKYSFIFLFYKYTINGIFEKSIGANDYLYGLFSLNE